MTTDSFFALACGSMILMLFGLTLAFAGYRFFMVLLPIWGFFFGFGLGAQTWQAIFGEGFLATTTSWIVGFVFAVVCAALSYVFYFFAVALIAGSLGYALGTGIMMAIFGNNLDFLSWAVGIVAAVVFAIGVLVLNIQKWVIIIATSLLGAGVIVGAFLFLFGKPTDIVQNPVKFALNNSIWWTIIFIVVAVLGFLAQYRTAQVWKLESYDRLEEYTGTQPAMAAAVPGGPSMPVQAMSTPPPTPPMAAEPTPPEPTPPTPSEPNTPPTS